MNAAWLRKLWAVRAALHLLAVGVVLGLPLAGQAQTTTVNVVSVAGGSSALLGEFAPLTYRQGPVPNVIESARVNIAGYRTRGVSDSGVLVVTNVTVRDPNTPTPGAPLEVVATGMVRWYREDASTINVIILLRSDSGNGVRYVANSARITDFPTMGSGMSVWSQRLTSSPPTFGPPAGDGLIVMDALMSNAYLDAGRTYGGSKLPIVTGYSDVAADTIVRYANFPNINVAGLQDVETPVANGPVQTLLLVHNNNMVYANGPAQIVFPRYSDPTIPQVGVQSLIHGDPTLWSEIDPTLQNTPIRPCRRENASGTRNTEYVNIQRILPNNPLSFVDDLCPDVCSGTGPMLSFVDTVPASFGYAFVGGVVGDNRPNTRVGAYQDSDGNISVPYDIDNGAADCSLPGNNGQSRYMADPGLLYQSHVVDGSYPLWSYAHVLSRPEPRYGLAASAQEDIFEALLLPSNPDFVHLEGLLRPNELTVERNYFISPITGEIVTDGQRVVPLGTAVQVSPPPDDDPIH